MHTHYFLASEKLHFATNFLHFAPNGLIGPGSNAQEGLNLPFQGEMLPA